MAENKENLKVNDKSKIPVTQERKFAPRKDDESRDPLKTLTCQNTVSNCLAGPSNSAGGKALDTRFVTVRKFYDNEELDWKLETFKEDYPPPSKEDKSTSTQRVPSIVLQTPDNETKAIKVKKSLKRPVSRLQDSGTSQVSSKKSKGSAEAGAPVCAFDRLNETYASDNLKYLQNIEKKAQGIPQINRKSRCCIINWIISVNRSSGGDPATVQLASWYLDSYLSTTSVSVERLQLIAAACFWIANKMHGGLVPIKRLVKYSDNAFKAQDLIAAEKNILRKLNFQALPVTPHDFVPYLAWSCDQSRTGVIEAAATFLCQCGIMVETIFTEEYASVIAAAAVKTALALFRKTASIENLKACPIYKAAEAKARHLNRTCTLLRDAVRIVSSPRCEYKAPLCQFSEPPHCIASKIASAVNFKEVQDLEEKYICLFS